MKRDRYIFETDGYVCFGYCTQCKGSEGNRLGVAKISGFARFDDILADVEWHEKEFHEEARIRELEARVAALEAKLK